MLALFHAEKAKDRDKAIKMLFDGAGRMGWPVPQAGDHRGKPWVSAINGTCMGGAFELSLACHGRVAADGDKVKMALPEVKVGIFPGAGGTQRVPRLANTQEALQMLTSGQSLSPQKAKAMGLIHEIAAPDKLVETAKAMIRNGLKPVAPWDEKGFKLPGGPVYSAAGANLWPPAIAILRRETYGNYPAAAAILKCVYEGLLVPFDTGLQDRAALLHRDHADDRSGDDDPLAVRVAAGTEQGRAPPGRRCRNQVQEDRRPRRRLHGRRHRLCDGQGRHSGRAGRPRHGRRPRRARRIRTG